MDCAAWLKSEQEIKEEECRIIRIGRYTSFGARTLGAATMKFKTSGSIGRKRFTGKQCQVVPWVPTSKVSRAYTIIVFWNRSGLECILAARRRAILAASLFVS